MSNTKDDFEWHKEAVEFQERRARRLKKFHDHLEGLQELAECWGTKIRMFNSGEQIQFACGEYLANYYPGTRRFFFQRPRLLPTIVVPPQEAITAFFRFAHQLAADPIQVFSACWDFESRHKPPEDVIRVGSYVLPQIREQVLRLLAHRYDLLNNISPREFEFLIARLLQDKGFRTTVTPATHDGGKDIIATRGTDDQQYILLVECKKWIEGKVGIDIIQRVFGVKYINDADECMVVTTARFSEPAIKEAEKKTSELSLVDSSALRNWLTNFDNRMKLADRPRPSLYLGRVRIDETLFELLSSFCNGGNVNVGDRNRG